jgi:HTH-type transcriptional regulator / antitoxin HigA
MKGGAMAPTTDNRYEPDLVLPPGDTLDELLDDIGMTQAELAKRTGLSTKHINQIVNGAAAITPETALLLERATGVGARTWSNLEVAYREYVSRKQEEERLTADIGWLDELPIKEMIKRGCIEKRDRAIDTLREVCRFFGVADKSAWETLWHKPTAYRTSKAFTSDPGAVAAWLRLGELQAVKVDCQAFDKAALTAALDDFRALTCEPDPSTWWPQLVERCRAAGVAVVGEPEIKGARINGAARWLAPDKALVQVSLRYRWNDIFWFTFFHEIGHLLIHSKKDAFINDVGAHSGAEQEADGFASQVLIPRRHEADLAELTTLQDANDFAEAIGVAPGVVVGRLQHDGRWPYSKGNDLKQRFVFSS